MLSVCSLTFRSSRARFAASTYVLAFSTSLGRKAARLNSGVRALMKLLSLFTALALAPASALAGICDRQHVDPEFPAGLGGRYELIGKNYPHHCAVMFGHYGKALYDALKYIGVDPANIGYNHPAGDRYVDENPFA